MKNVAAIYPHTPLYPTRYFSFVRELTLHNQDTSELSESWDLELPENSKSDAVLYALPTFPGKTQYKELLINIIGGDKKEVSLPIEFETFEIPDEVAQKITMSIPFVRIPVNKNTQRVLVRFKIEAKQGDAIDIYGQQMLLPDTISVDKAMLILLSDASNSANVSLKIEDLRLAKLSKKWPNSTNFCIKRKVEPKRKSAKIRCTKIALSFKTWSEIAKRHGQFYQNEISRTSKSHSTHSTSSLAYSRKKP